MMRLVPTRNKLVTLSVRVYQYHHRPLPSIREKCGHGLNLFLPFVINAATLAGTSIARRISQASHCPTHLPHDKKTLKPNDLVINSSTSRYYSTSLPFGADDERPNFKLGLEAKVVSELRVYYITWRMGGVALWQ
ncbi:hypothetical protein L218DRAFT_765580 [Marasmius fiardii PR-910]|nr:hypothetical protein L218DRAFT_765580 [Marasmius fiardii PR-910]